MALTKVKGAVWDSSDNTLFISVKDYGAKGDGSTDDTDAIQAAIDAAELNTPELFSTYGAGRKVYFPAGVYVVNATLNINQDGVVLEGESRVSTVIRKDTANTNTLYFGLSNPTNNQRINGCGIRNISLVYNGGNDPSAGSHVYFDRARSSVVDNCSLINHYRGIAMVGVDEHCRVTDTLIQQGGNTTALQAGSSGITITRREVQSSDPNAVQDTADSLYYVRSGSVHIDNCQIVGNQYGMDFCINVEAVDGLYIDNSHIGWSINEIIRIRPVQNNLNILNIYGNNLLLDATSSNIGDGTVETLRALLYEVNGALSSQPTVAFHRWSNCSFAGNDDIGMWIQDGWTTNLHDIEFTGCSFKNAIDEGARVESGFEITFSGCSFDGNDSDATGSHAHLYIDTNKVTVTGCKFSGTTARGIYLDTNANYVAVTGCTIFGTTSQAILIDTINDKNRFSDILTDEGDSIASAGTIEIPASLDTVYITGTTTINSIKASTGSGGSSGWNTRVVNLIFDSACSVGDGVGNIKLAGSFTSTADDVLTLVFRTDTWYEVSRSVN